MTGPRTAVGAATHRPPHRARAVVLALAGLVHVTANITIGVLAVFLLG